MSDRFPELPSLPEAVIVRALRFEPTADAESSPHFAGITMPSMMARAVTKRRVEFLAGRWCARDALRALASAHADREIAVGEDRAPQWPEGVVGAISHTEGLAASAVAHAHVVRGVGLDVQRIMTPEVANNVRSYITADGELDQACDRTALTPEALLTVVFGAKECIYKCLYPEVRRIFGFHDARVLSVDAARGTFEADLVVSLTERLPAGSRFRGTFSIAEGIVGSGLVLFRDDRP